MGQKVNPISLRLQKTNRFYESSWFGNKNYNGLISQDLIIRGYLNSVLKQIRYPQGRFFLKYMHKKVSIYSFLHNPHRSRKERANLLSSQKSFKTRPSMVQSKFHAHINATKVIQQASLIKENQIKQLFSCTPFLHSQSKQSSRLRNRLSIVKKSFCYLKNLQNLNKQRVNSLFYMLHGLYSKNRTFFTYPKGSDKITVSILEKQFYIRYFLASFFSVKNSFSVYPIVNKPGFTSNFVKLKKNSSDYVGCLDKDYQVRISSHWKKNLVNRFLMFRFLEKEVGTLLSTKYSEKPRISGLKDINLETYPKTKNRFALINRVFSKFYGNFSVNQGKKNLASQALGSRLPLPLLTQQETSQHWEGNTSKKNCELACPRKGFDSFLPLANSGRTNAASTASSAASSLLGCALAKAMTTTELTKKPLAFFARADCIKPITKSSAARSSAESLPSAGSAKSNLEVTKLGQLKQLIGLKKASTFIIKDTPYRNHLESVVLKRLDLSVEFFPFQAFSDSQSAVFLANEIVFYLEQRVAFRRIKTKLFKEIAKKHWIKGIRISCSGRLGGRSKKAQRSKTECVKLGQTSLHVFSSKMDFAYKSALTPFGLVGVKVWISYK